MNTHKCEQPCSFKPIGVLGHRTRIKYSTNAANTAIGAALEQLEDSVWNVGFFSRKLNEIEQRYAANDCELLTVFAAIKFFRRILEGRPFTVKTDHKPLIFAEYQRSNKATPRQQRQLFASWVKRMLSQMLFLAHAPLQCRPLAKPNPRIMTFSTSISQTYCLRCCTRVLTSKWKNKPHDGAKILVAWSEERCASMDPHV